MSSAVPALALAVAVGSYVAVLAGARLLDAVGDSSTQLAAVGVIALAGVYVGVVAATVRLARDEDVARRHLGRRIAVASVFLSVAIAAIAAVIT